MIEAPLMPLQLLVRQIRVWSIGRVSRYWVVHDVMNVPQSKARECKIRKQGQFGIIIRADNRCTWFHVNRFYRYNSIVRTSPMEYYFCLFESLNLISPAGLPESMEIVRH